MPFRPITQGVPPPPSFFAEIVDYIGFTSEDSRCLLDFLPIAQSHFDELAEHFYERILAHAPAREAISGGHEEVEHLKHSLVEWMQSGLAGAHDHEFWMARAMISHIHARIGLPQRYMVTAMNVMRLDFRRVVEQELASIPLARLRKLNDALDRWFDLELAIMLETYRLEAEDRLRRRERLATIGQLAASIGHDLRNPLSVMESSLYILRRRVKDDERALKHVDRISHQIDECDSIITHLLELARNQPPRRDRVDMTNLVEDALAAARIPVRMRVERHGLESLVLWIDGALIKQALVNLLINSVQAQREGDGWISIGASRENDHVVIALEDTGPGFDKATLPIIFEPLVTTKATGTGLGLSLVKSVIERHNGHVSASNRVGGGAVVKLYLPDAVPGPTVS